MSHAENAIHRSANLVTHVCQEITLCLCRLLSLLPCRANCFLRAFALGNVSPNRVDQPPAVLLDGRQQDFDREDLAVSAPVQPLEAEAAALHHLRHEICAFSADGVPSAWIGGERSMGL